MWSHIPLFIFVYTLSETNWRIFFYSAFSNLKFKTLGRVFTILNFKKKGGGGVLCLHIHLLKSKSRVADCQFQHDKRFSLTFWKFFFYYYYKFIHLAYHMLQTHNAEFKHKVSSQTDCLCCLCLFQTLLKNHYPFFSYWFIATLKYL